MREILVRGYSKEKLCKEDQWVEGFGVLRTEMADGTTDCFLLTPYGDYEVIEDSIGEFTGLFDADDKPIFEGDIVDFRVWDHFWIEGKATVYFDEGSFRLNSKHPLSDYLEYEGSVKITGNIYEESIA